MFMVGATDNALSTGDLSALEQAIIPPVTNAATNMIFLMLSPDWGVLASL
jgi:hypothetical protein